MTVEEQFENKGQEALKKHKEKQDQLKKVLNMAFSTYEGKLALQYIFEICGQVRNSVTANPQTAEVQPLNCLYNEARRSVYLELRRLVDANVIAEVENQKIYSSAKNPIDELLA